MAPNIWVSLVLAPATKTALEACILQIQATSPIPLNAMSNTDMHMTLVFLGSARLSSAKRAELDSLLHTFSEAAAPLPALEFEVLELFPPTKRNLLIARYRMQGETLTVLRKLQMQCFDLGLVSREEHERSQNTEFVAHVTLGKFRGMRADQCSDVEKAVATVISGLDDSKGEALKLPFDTACLCEKK